MGGQIDQNTETWECSGADTGIPHPRRHTESDAVTEQALLLVSK